MNLRIAQEIYRYNSMNINAISFYQVGDGLEFPYLHSKLSISYNDDKKTQNLVQK